MLPGFRFERVTRKLRWRYIHEGVIVDRDGSFTGGAGMSKVVPYTGIMDTSVCPVTFIDLLTTIYLRESFYIKTRQSFDIKAKHWKHLRNNKINLHLDVWVSRLNRTISAPTHGLR